MDSRKKPEVDREATKTEGGGKKYSVQWRDEYGIDRDSLVRSTTAKEEGTPDRDRFTPWALEQRRNPDR